MSAAEQPEWKYSPLPLDIEVEYASSTLNQDARFVFYTFAEPRIDPEKLLQSELELRGDETVLDVGCGSGKTLVGLREQGHYGQLIGVDISEDLFYVSKTITQQEGLDPIDFRVGNAELLDLPDNSVDVSTAMFMLYHCNPIKALEELKRVTRPGGTIVVATSGPLNKFYHRAFEGLLAEELGYHPSPRFNVGFDTTKADRLLPKMFPEIRRIEHRGYVNLSNKPENTAAREAFEQSLLTMKDSMRPIDPRNHPTPTYAEWKAAVDRIWYAMDETDREIPNNSLVEFIERDYYFCTNPDKS